MAFHDICASILRRRFSARFISALAVWDIERPFSEALSNSIRVTDILHIEQKRCPTPILAPHVLQRCGGRAGEISTLGKFSLPYCLRAVALLRFPSAPIVDFKTRHTLWVIGKSNRPHASAVSESFRASDAINLQVPSRCSKNHSRLRVSSEIHRSKNSSTRGLTGSMRSHAKLSRASVST